MGILKSVNTLTKACQCSECVMRTFAYSRAKLFVVQSSKSISVRDTQACHQSQV